jgi:uncharacterized protein YvpB
MVILEVPYYSQFLDVDDKKWMPKSCAIVCLKMILHYHNDRSLPLMDLIGLGESKGGYGPSGWYHDTLVELAEDYELKARRVEGVNVEDGIKDIKSSLEKGNPVIVSAIKYILGQTKFHMVVVTGFEEEDGQITGFYYHDPESADREKGQNIFTDIKTFTGGWRRMAIFIYPQNH